MQNSLWKLISVVGVVAIGTLVVLEVQERLPAPGTIPPGIEDTALEDTLFDGDAERHRTAETDVSPFEEHHGRVASAGNDAGTPAGEDDADFQDLFQLDEPEIRTSRAVDSGANRVEVTDNRDPFADPQQADLNFTDEDRQSTPAQPVAFAGESTATPADDGDLFDFAMEPDDRDAADADASFTPDSVSVVLPAGNEVREPDTVADPFPTDSGSEDFASTAADHFGERDEHDHDRRDDPAANRGRSGGDRLLFYPEGPDTPTDNRADAVRAPEFEFTDPEPVSDDPFAAEDLEPVPELLDLSDSGDRFAEEAELQSTPNNGAEDFRTPFTDRREPEGRLDLNTTAELAPADDLGGPMFGEDDADPADVPLFSSDLDESNDDSEPDFRGDRSPASRDDSERSFPELRDSRDDGELELPDPALPGRNDDAPEGRFNMEEDRRTVPDRHDLPARDRRTLPDRRDDLDDIRVQPRRRSNDRSREDENRDSNLMEIRPLRGRRDRDDVDELPEFRPTESSEVPESAASSTGILRPHLTVTKQMQETATLGVPLNYTLVVTNEGASSASDVVIEDVVPVAARVEAVDPPPEYDRKTRKLIWEFPELRAGESRELKVQLTPTEQGMLNSVATVRFKAQVATSTVVQAPRLILKLAAPREVKVGSETQLRYLVRNEGDGTATDVVLRSDLPAGLQHPIGNDLEYAIDTLAPGQEQEVVLDVLAAEPGRFTSTAEVLAAGMAPQATETSVNIVGQQTQVVRRGPPRRYVGRSAVYENILTNETSFDAAGIRVVEVVPEGMRFDKASHGGVYNPQQRAVTWTLDQIDPGATETLKIRLVAESSGDQESSVTVLENAGYQTAASHITAVEDLHNIGMRMSRLSGPVSVGREFGFDILVENRGTADATGVQLTIDLPDGLRGVSVGKGGPRADPSIESGHLQYHFEPIERIESGGQMTFRINLKATERMSNGIVNARIQYDQMKQELVTSEAVTASDDAP